MIKKYVVKKIHNRFYHDYFGIVSRKTAANIHATMIQMKGNDIQIKAS